MIKKIKQAFWNENDKNRGHVINVPNCCFFLLIRFRIILNKQKNYGNDQSGNRKLDSTFERFCLRIKHPET